MRFSARHDNTTQENQTHMTTIEKNAYICALEKKLFEAERALHGFRRIFEYYTAGAPTPVLVRSVSQGSEREGLFPGQRDNMVEQYEKFDPAEAGKSASECIE